MAYIRCDIQSETLEMCTSFIALLPDGATMSEVPGVYLLHGLSDNCTGWTRYTAVERYAREKGVAVIMPEVQRSFYTDMVYGIKYFSFIRDELPEICHRLFGLSKVRELNYVMGLSMGGYGALKCALNAPEKYAGCAFFSAVTDLPGRIVRAEEAQQREFIACFGPDGKVCPEGDLFALAETADPAKLPRFFITCGEQDGLYEDSVRMSELLEKRGCCVDFRHWEGTHSWELWDKSIRMAFGELIK